MANNSSESPKDFVGPKVKSPKGPVMTISDKNPNKHELPAAAEESSGKRLKLTQGDDAPDASGPKPTGQPPVGPDPLASMAVASAGQALPAPSPALASSPHLAFAPAAALAPPNPSPNPGPSHPPPSPALPLAPAAAPAQPPTNVAGPTAANERLAVANDRLAKARARYTTLEDSLLADPTNQVLRPALAKAEVEIAEAKQAVAEAKQAVAVQNLYAAKAADDAELIALARNEVAEAGKDLAEAKAARKARGTAPQGGQTVPAVLPANPWSPDELRDWADSLGGKRLLAWTPESAERFDLPLCDREQALSDFDRALEQRLVSPAVFEANAGDRKRKGLICFVGLPDIGKTRMLWEILPLVQQRLDFLAKQGPAAEEQGWLPVSDPRMLPLYVGYQNGSKWCPADVANPAGSLACRLLHSYFGLRKSMPYRDFADELQAASPATFRTLSIGKALKLIRNLSGISHIVILFDEFQAAVDADDSAQLPALLNGVIEIHTTDQRCLWVLAGTDFAALDLTSSQYGIPLGRIPLKFMALDHKLLAHPALAPHTPYLAFRKRLPLLGSIPGLLSQMLAAVLQIRNYDQSFNRVVDTWTRRCDKTLMQGNRRIEVLETMLATAVTGQRVSYLQSVLPGQQRPTWSQCEEYGICTIQDGLVLLPMAFFLLLKGTCFDDLAQKFLDINDHQWDTPHWDLFEQLGALQMALLERSHHYLKQPLTLPWPGAADLKPPSVSLEPARLRSKLLDRVADASTVFALTRTAQVIRTSAVAHLPPRVSVAAPFVFLAPPGYQGIDAFTTFKAEEAADNVGIVLAEQYKYRADRLTRGKLDQLVRKLKPVDEIDYFGVVTTAEWDGQPLEGQEGMPHVYVVGRAQLADHFHLFADHPLLAAKVDLNDPMLTAAWISPRLGGYQRQPGLSKKNILSNVAGWTLANRALCTEEVAWRDNLGKQPPPGCPAQDWARVVAGLTLDAHWYIPNAVRQIL